jgi:hypothetical protein
MEIFGVVLASGSSGRDSSTLLFSLPNWAQFVFRPTITFSDVLIWACYMGSVITAKTAIAQ